MDCPSQIGEVPLAVGVATGGLTTTLTVEALLAEQPATVMLTE